MLVPMPSPSRVLPLLVALALPALVAAQTTTPTPQQTPQFSINHFGCYALGSGPFSRFDVTLEDEFGLTASKIRRPKRICNPANTNGQNPGAANARDHLVAYHIKRSTPRLDPIKNVQVFNQFHPVEPLVVDVIRPDFMMVPSLKSRTQQPTPAPFLLDHFKCYRVKGARFRRAGVTIQDQFGTILVDIKRPRRLCVPAEKNNGGGPINPRDHLMCYEIRRAKGSPFTPAGQIFINNQFGPDTFEAFRPTELCAPSLVDLGNGSCSVRGGAGAPICGGQCPSPNQRCLFGAPVMGGPDMGGPDMGGPDMGGPDAPATCSCHPVTDACEQGAATGICGGLCPSASETCLAFSGPDMGGPDMGGPDMSGPEACACRPTTEACAFSATSGMCGGLCPNPTDACLALSGPDMGGPDMGGPDMGGPDMSGPECACRPQTTACTFASGMCGGLCPTPNDLCLSLSGPDMGGPDVSGPEASCTCRPASQKCGATGGVCGGLCPKPSASCLDLRGPDMGGPDMGGPDAPSCNCVP